MYFEALIQDISPIEAMEYTKYMKPTPNKNHVPGTAGPLSDARRGARPCRKSSLTKIRHQKLISPPGKIVPGSPCIFSKNIV